ncbi:hypothetical protein ONZ45_g9529 [Pleurotus djamor]|nr:hypothetical protein ONZ45_g9529 [Pleurotus djamor]
MSSSSSSSSRSPSPEPVVKKSKKPNGPSSSKDEGNSPFQPPPKAVLLDHTDFNDDDFDWDAVAANDDCEVWLIRIPDGVKPKYLENLKIELPPTTSRSTKVGTLNRKLANYDVWSIGDGHAERDDADASIVGEEIRNLTCLLPRKGKQGQLYQSPKPITRRLVVAAQPVTPSLADAPAPVLYQNPPRQSYPKELLRHRFMPFGSEVTEITEQQADVTAMDVDSPTQKKDKVHSKEVAPASPVKVKGKKRKGDEATSLSKKSKKIKTASHVVDD